MAHSYRHPSGIYPLASNNMGHPIRVPDVSLRPVNAPNCGFVPVPQQQYIIQPMVFSPQGMINQISAPTNIPRMFVPVVQGATQTRLQANNPAKQYEEQQKFEKERNFQMQQQRLKQFTVAGKKGSMNADNLIDSMFGKVPPRRNSFGSETNNKQENCTSPVLPASQHINIPVTSSESNVPNGVTQNNSLERNSSMKSKISKDGKQLDTMMFECSNLAGPLKAKTFHKPSVKELPRSSHHAATFASSEKARDWRNVQELNNMFTLPKERFPAWCCTAGVPEIFHRVEAFARGNCHQGFDNTLLLPVLMSSGLPREVLGQIWDLVNETKPNELTSIELYATLALIALAQNGHQITSTDILHSLPVCPVPQLSNFMNFLEHGVHTNHGELNETTVFSSNPENVSSCIDSETEAHKTIRPTAIRLSETHHLSCSSENLSSTVSSLENNIQSWKPFESSGFVSSLDDDFDDFKSATPTAVNVSITTPTDTNKSDDDFDDFKQAPLINSSETSAKEQTVQLNSSTCDQDLMSPEEDKYSVFRSLQHQEEETAEWSDFSSVRLNPQEHKIDEKSSSFKNEIDCNFSSANPVPSQDIHSETDFFALCKKKDVPQADDDFGDFFQADVTSTSIPSIAISQDTFTPNFADFDKQNGTLANFNIPYDSSDFQQSSNSFTQISTTKEIDSEFGEFASSMPVTYKPELLQEFHFRHLKDNISLSESQSVSSLELGTFDSGGHNGDSSLSRQGSIPSLDLKSVDNDDGFGEMQSSVPSKSPSPSKDLKTHEDKNLSNIPSGLIFQTTSTISLVDKYSVIRSEQNKEDQHISDWIRCLQSGLNILVDAKRIFNQMSCSSVCNEVINSFEGENYIKNVIEIYKVICRISLASKSFGKQTEKLLQLVKESDLVWNTMCGFFSGSNLMPEDTAFDFSSGVLHSDTENNLKACGLCLLNVDARSKAFDKVEDTKKLSYGGRNYHSTCANLWVNCVDPLLPALTLSQLL